MLGEFDLLMPESLAEALQWLADGGSRIAPLAGGTNLIVDMRAGRARPAVLMDVGRLAELRGARCVDGEMVVGAATTIAELLADPLVRQHGGPLREAAAAFANPLVRNRATLGGNLADASPAADTAPALLARTARVELVSQRGPRCLPLEDFLCGPHRTQLAPDELLVAVRWPAPAAGARAAFHKLGLRKADAIAVLSAAVMVEWAPATEVPGGEVEGLRLARRAGQLALLCREARIALGAVAPTARRARAAEAALRGQVLVPEAVRGAIAGAARLAAEAASPISDVRGSAAYRRRVVEVTVRRLLERTAPQEGE